MSITDALQTATLILQSVAIILLCVVNAYLLRRLRAQRARPPHDDEEGMGTVPSRWGAG